eukprot:353572-Chlamydomonas_euryale.AAC.3
MSRVDLMSHTTPAWKAHSPRGMACPQRQQASARSFSTAAASVQPCLLASTEHRTMQATNDN